MSVLMSHESQYHLSHIDLANSTIKKVPNYLYRTVTNLEFAVLHTHIKCKQITHTKLYISKYTLKSPFKF